MAELRSVDPRTLIPNPNNPRRTPPPRAMDEQLLASIRAVGIIQPPLVREIDGKLVIRAGDRRVKFAIAAGKDVIDVYVKDSDDAAAPMESLSENLIRAAMNSVDTWRAVEELERQGWNEQAIADALALPVRTVRRLKLLAHLHPPMLDAMAKGSTPSEEQLRTIAAATRDEQAQVWKAHKPKKGEQPQWHGIAYALSKRRIPASAAKFDDDLARAYGVVWEDDLFAPAGEDGRYTTNVEGFFGAQQEWLANNLPERSTLLTLNEYGQPQLPKKAEKVWGKPHKGDITGHYIDQRTGETGTVVYRMPPAVPKKTDQGAGEETPVKPSRPDVTQKGLAMIGDLRTDALHEALAKAEIDDATLIALLVLAFTGLNVSVQSGTNQGRGDRRAIAARLVEGGVVTRDDVLIRTAARDTLIAVLSCRANASSSGPAARIAGESIGATTFLPSMATDDFLSCLSRQVLEKIASENGVRIAPRVKDTRAGVIEHFADATWRFADALFTVPAEKLAQWREEVDDWPIDPETSDESLDDQAADCNDDLTGERGGEDRSAYPQAAD